MATKKTAAVSAAPTTTKELRERINAAWDKECKKAVENGWCQDGKTILTDLGFRNKLRQNVTVKLIASGYPYDDVSLNRHIQNIFKVHHYAEFEGSDIEIAIEDIDEDTAPIDAVALDDAIARLHRTARDMLHRYGERRGLEDAIRNTLAAAGVPLPEVKKQSYTIVVEGTSDMTAEDLATYLRDSVLFPNMRDAKYSAVETVKDSAATA